MANERFIGTPRSTTSSPSSTPTTIAGCWTASPEQASAVIHNSIVFEQTQEDSLTDQLTGLPNTRYMFAHLTRELARAQRMRAEVALLVMDLDDFKAINDTFGHNAGDRALREVARLLRAAIRPYDICVRYAGDEFVVVLAVRRRGGRAQARRVAARRRGVRLRAAARPPPAARHLGRRRHLPRDGDGYEALMATADSRIPRQDEAQAPPRPARAGGARRGGHRHRRPAGAVVHLAALASPPTSTSSAGSGVL